MVSCSLVMEIEGVTKTKTLAIPLRFGACAFLLSRNQFVHCIKNVKNGIYILILFHSVVLEKIIAKFD
jgi:hypothetical protein